MLIFYVCDLSRWRMLKYGIRCRNYQIAHDMVKTCAGLHNEILKHDKNTTSWWDYGAVDDDSGVDSDLNEATRLHGFDHQANERIEFDEYSSRNESSASASSSSSSSSSSMVSHVDVSASDVTYEQRRSLMINHYACMYELRLVYWGPSKKSNNLNNRIV